MNKSDEEIAWLRIGAALSDAGMAALIAGTRPGMTEHELGNMIERAYVGLGGTTVIHFIGSTPMAYARCVRPAAVHVPAQDCGGDFVFCELSAAWWDYSGQVLRGFTVEAEPRALYRDLHATAVAAYKAITKAIAPGVAAADLIEASALIEKTASPHTMMSSTATVAVISRPSGLQKPARRTSCDADATREHVPGSAA